MTKERQHTVPKFLLKNFTKGKTLQIFVYDKSNDNEFQTNINNIAAEKGFYDIETEDRILTMEPGLANIEANTSAIIKKIIKQRTLKCLDEYETVILAAFLAIQFVRTKEHRLKFKHLGKELIQKLRRMGVTEENIEELTKNSMGLPEDKIFGVKSIVHAEKHIPYFLNKQWVLFATTPKFPFFISDNPIALHNELDHGPYGNLGLAVKGIEIYFPISTTLSLCLLCPSINFRDGLINGTPITNEEDEVTMMNSLQVIYSSRFVYCETNTFDLVKRMINDNDKYRKGLKPTTS